MEEKLKHPQCLMDAEGLASHMSMHTTKSSNSKSGKGSKINATSRSQLKESTMKSQTSDKLSATSMSNTQTQGISSETVKGDFAADAKNVEYVQQDLPETMLNAIRIIERLVTQTEYHESQVLYKDYPAVKVGDKRKTYEEEEEEGVKKPLFARLKEKQKEKEEEEKKEEEEAEKEKEDPDAIKLKHLFKFEFSKTEGRPISCIDLNSANTDLVAVAYGEFDIDCQNLKQGIIAFWTLKNPTYPEKHIITDHSITCLQFSKKNPHLLAAGDSHGNIMIYNVKQIKGADSKPIAESKDLEDKHSDIIWEVQWVDREKGEALISISGDGRVIEWSMKKGLEYTPLMQLKRETNPN